MGVQKNATYKVHNGVDFDEINFKTLASQVKMASGTTAEVEINSKMKIGELSQSQIEGVLGGNWSIQVYQRVLQEGQTDIILINCQKPTAKHNYCNQMFMVTCNWFGELNISPVINDTNGYSCIVQQSTVGSSTYDIKIGDNQVGDWKPNINIIRVLNRRW